MDGHHNKDTSVHPYTWKTGMPIAIAISISEKLALIGSGMSPEIDNTPLTRKYLEEVTVSNGRGNAFES